MFQLLKQQYSRYTPEMVERITGIPANRFLDAADLFTSIRKDGDMKKVATIIYAVGWTQHTFGTQIIRTAAMLQLLLGNVGRAGGGVNALRGHSNIQGATDMAGVFDLLPGYLKMPAPDDADLATYLERTTPAASKPAEWDSYNYWSNTPKFMVSFLKALYGDAARKDNDFAFQYLPKIDRRYSWVEIWDDMYNGRVKGMFAFGMNAVQIGPNSRKIIDALKKADWLVVGEIYPDETSDFWRAPGTTPEEMKTIRTSVYRLPCAGFAEKDGTFVNSARWLQWKNIALRAARRREGRPGNPLARVPQSSRAVPSERAGNVPIRFSTRRGITWIRFTAPSWSSRGRSTVGRLRISPIRTGSRSKPASSCRASRRSGTMARRCAQTGCTADRGPRPAQ